MKTSIIKKQILLLLLVVAAFQVNSQVVPDNEYHNRLFYLCKVWGHAKYYHTRIAAGLVNWDNELLKAVSGAKNAPTSAAFNDSLLLMLNNAGVMGTSTVALPEIPDSLNNNNDMSWIQSLFISDLVRANLNTITSRFRPQTNVYVGNVPTAGNPTFDKDTLFFTGPDYPSEGKRMLAMFRYWNQVHYFYPNKKIMDQNWDTTLTEFIPKIAESTDALSFNQAFRELRARINDGHAAYSSPFINKWFGSCHAPFLVRYIENEMVITNVLPGITGVAVGNVIKEIDGVDVHQLRDSLRKYAFGSNNVSIERTLNGHILSGNPGDFQVTVFNGSETHTTTLNKNETNYNNLLINNSPIWKDTVINNNCTFGIVDMGRLETTQVGEMFADLWNAKAIIFDIRNYPLGTLWTIVDYLFSSTIHIANFTIPDINYPGRLYWQPGAGGKGTSNPYKGQVILLFDDRTQSQAEYTCMGIEQFPGAIKIGSTTAGADGNISKTYLPGNISTIFTGLGTYYPDYTPTQRVGIIPDYEVHPTISGIRAGKDELLNFALNSDLIGAKFCSSFGNNTSSEWINKVILGNFSNTTGVNGGYGYFRNPAIQVESGLTYNLTLIPGFSNRTKSEYWRVWIDYNKDGDFSDVGEQVFAANGTKVAVNGNIIIPLGISGETRMRISMKFNATPNYCEQFSYGEVEDYLLYISPFKTYPPVANFSGTPTSLLTGQSVKFTDLSTNNPTSWSWTFEGGTPSSGSSQNPSVTYQVAGIYDVTIEVTNAEGSSVLTLPDYVTVTEAGSVTYCASKSNSNALEWIGKVDIASFTNPSGASFYTDFTTSVIQLNPGSLNLVTFTPVFTSSAQFEYWKVWIDFNKDGDFNDNGEQVFAANKKKTVIAGTISIPTSANGQTKMRISMKNGSTPSPCENFNKGEVEDYMVNFTGTSKSKTVFPDFDVLIYPNPAYDYLNLVILGNLSATSVKIYNATGSLMDRFSFESGNHQINLDKYTRGLYFVKVADENVGIIRKFIKN